MQINVNIQLTVNISIDLAGTELNFCRKVKNSAGLKILGVKLPNRHATSENQTDFIQK